MRILVACEESQTVCIAFREKGYEAYSCDVIDCSGGHPEWHIKDDYRNAVRYDKWDLLIAFPPCTHLAVSGARWFKFKEREQSEAINFFLGITHKPIEKIAIENPIGIMSTIYRKPDQIIQPWMFGDSYSKSTCLWLNGLPILLSTQIVDKGKYIQYDSGRRMPEWYANAYKCKPDEHAKLRSKTFPGIAKALADQYSAFILSGLSIKEFEKLDISEINRINA